MNPPVPQVESPRVDPNVQRFLEVSARVLRRLMEKEAKE